MGLVKSLWGGDGATVRASLLTWIPETVAGPHRPACRIPSKVPENSEFSGRLDDSYN